MLARAFGLTLAALLLIPHSAQAQDSAKPRRVGVLFSGSPSDPVIKHVREVLVDGLRKRGWEEGRNLVLESRFTGPDPTRLHELAGELVALKVDVIVAGNSQSTEAARRKTATIPIVMLNVAAPVTSGFVASLVRPGGNITGLATQLEAAAAKGFELLKEVDPGIQRVGIIYSPANTGSVATLRHQQEQVPLRLGLSVVPIPISKPTDFDTAFATIAPERLQALFVHPLPIVVSHRRKVCGVRNRAASADRHQRRHPDPRRVLNVLWAGRGGELASQRGVCGSHLEGL